MRKFYDILFHRPMNFSFVDEHVCGSARIMSKRDLEWLRMNGIDAVLALTESPAPSTWLENSGLEYRHVPVKNHTAPSLAQLDESVDFIEDNIQNGKKTLVHCAAGKGRTGTIIAAYLCRKNSVSAEDAMRSVREKRPGSIEGGARAGQEKVVIEYCDLLKNKKAKDGP